MSSFMNPFHNMSKYRELQRSTPPPLIPFFPIIKKDLTFLFDGNESQVKGLVNFEKLRMLARQIRLIKTYCQQPIIVSVHALSLDTPLSCLTSPYLADPTFSSETWHCHANGAHTYPL